MAAGGALLAVTDLLLQICRSARKLSFLAAQFLGLLAEIRSHLLRIFGRLLLERLLQHRDLSLVIPKPSCQLAGLLIHRFLLSPPLALQLPDILHAHGATEVLEVPSYSFADSRLDATLLLPKPPLLRGQTSRLGRQAAQGDLKLLQLLGFLRQLPLAPLQPRRRLRGLGLRLSRLLLQGRQVGPQRSIQRVDRIQPPVQRIQARLGGLHLGEVEASRTFLCSIRVHGQVSILGNRLPHECHNLAGDFQLPRLFKGHAPTIRHCVRNHDIPKDKVEGFRVHLVEGDTVQAQPESSLAVHQVLQARVEGGHSQVCHGQEGHGRQHSLLQVAHTCFCRFAVVHHDGVQELANGHIHRYVQPLLRGLAKIHDAPVHPGVVFHQ
mmetsp:Transcript_86695/g.207555  ORF Transcript_86695/g.207555 Transcript_86695/m.207555 type:complete len:380 (+) Transcript_86695:1101-2240(+)